MTFLWKIRASVMIERPYLFRCNVKVIKPAVILLLLLLFKKSVMKGWERFTPYQSYDPIPTLPIKERSKRENRSRKRREQLCLETDSAIR